ncbi:MAG: type II 3-dehydroquinate dehydratase, partial [Elusimicrobiota bacterium]
MNILIINGPNLNLLSKRRPEIYGKQTLKEINQNIKKYLTGKHTRVKF